MVLAAVAKELMEISACIGLSDNFTANRYSPEKGI